MIMSRVLATLALMVVTSAFGQDLTHPTRMNLPESQFERPDPAEYELRLDNGLTAYIASADQVPLVTLSAFVRAGKVNDEVQGAAEALSEALRMEVAGSAIKVSCIEPGLVMTELHRDLPAHPKETLGVERPLAPDDIARMVLFVAEQPDHVAVPRLMVLPQDQAI